MSFRRQKAAKQRLNPSQHLVLLTSSAPRRRRCGGDFLHRWIRKKETDPFWSTRILITCILTLVTQPLSLQSRVSGTSAPEAPAKGDGALCRSVGGLSVARDCEISSGVYEGVNSSWSEFSFTRWTGQFVHKPSENNELTFVLYFFGHTGASIHHLIKLFFSQQIFNFKSEFKKLQSDSF